VRLIVAIVTHMHNIRRKWIRLSAPHIKLPTELDRAKCTQKQARTALAESARRCAEMIREALAAMSKMRAEEGVALAAWCFWSVYSAEFVFEV